MLKDILGLNEGDVLSLVGSGGKTTTMYQLGRELKDSKVLLTTSTKIKSEDIKGITTVEDFEKLEEITIENTNYMSGNIVDNNKFTGITNEQLEKVKDKFDYVIVEADGSKRLPLKGWRDREPVILENSNKTMGIFPFDLINEPLSDIGIFNEDLFFDIVGKDRKRFDTNCILKIIESENGIFKNTKGEKYIFLNKCDNDTLRKEAVKTINELKEIVKDVKFIYGSSTIGEYYVG